MFIVVSVNDHNNDHPPRYRSVAAATKWYLGGN